MFQAVPAVSAKFKAKGEQAALFEGVPPFGALPAAPLARGIAQSAAAQHCRQRSGRQSKKVVERRSEVALGVLACPGHTTAADSMSDLNDIRAKNLGTDRARSAGKR